MVVIDGVTPELAEQGAQALSEAKNSGRNRAMVWPVPARAGKGEPTETAPGERCGGAQLVVAGGEGVVVVDAEQKGIGRLPGKAQRPCLEEDAAHGGGA